MLPLRLYSAVSEVCVAPIMAASTLFKAGSSAARQSLALDATPRPSGGYLLWVHGASVGESVSALPLVRALLARDTRSSVLMTVGTATALARLSMERLGPRVLLQHRPADGVFTVNRFLRWWRPDGLLLLESELWPNLLLQTRASGVPIALVNARLSERSLARWQAVAPATLHELLGCCAVTLAQTPRMAERLRLAGSRAAVYRGDLKQARSSVGSASEGSSSVIGGRSGSSADSGRRGSEDGGGRSRNPLAGEEAMAGLRAAIGGRPVGSLWLAASTHEGDEAAVLHAHAALRRGLHPDLLLLLVPRHPERGVRVAAAGHAAGLTVARRSAEEVVGPATAVYVCDTLGELPALYSLSGIAFVGGSLARLGGHNLLEAAQASGGCVVLHGPHVESTAMAADALAATEPPAARCVRSAEELCAALGEVLGDEHLREATRKAASRAAHALEEGVLERVWAELEGPLGLPKATNSTPQRSAALTA